MWIFWILVIAVIFFVIRAMAGNDGGSMMGGGGHQRDETPLDILKKRYARGEIDEQEFIQRRKELEK